MKKVVKFLKEVKEELKKVQWPSKNQLFRLTAIVVFITIVISLYLGALDFIFAKMMEAVFK